MLRPIDAIVLFFLTIVILVYVILCMRRNSCSWFAGKCCKMSFTFSSVNHIHQDDNRIMKGKIISYTRVWSAYGSLLEPAKSEMMNFGLLTDNCMQYLKLFKNLSALVQQNFTKYEHCRCWRFNVHIETHFPSQLGTILKGESCVCLELLVF